MFIIISPRESINTDHIECMDVYSNPAERRFFLRFYMISKKEIQIPFNKQEELDVFHENLLLELKAKTLRKEKNLTIT